jgi:hypothetical protein
LFDCGANVEAYWNNSNLLFQGKKCDKRCQTLLNGRNVRESLPGGYACEFGFALVSLVGSENMTVWSERRRLA